MKLLLEKDKSYWFVQLSSTIRGDKITSQDSISTKRPASVKIIEKTDSYLRIKSKFGSTRGFEIDSSIELDKSGYVSRSGEWGIFTEERDAIDYWNSRIREFEDYWIGFHEKVMDNFNRKRIKE